MEDRGAADPARGGGPGAVPAEEVVALGQLWRIEGVVTAVRAELAVIAAEPDGELAHRAAAVGRRCRRELGRAVPASLVPELDRLLQWADGEPGGASEVRISLAQLDGWLGGLLSGLGYVLSVRPES